LNYSESAEFSEVEVSNLVDIEDQPINLLNHNSKTCSYNKFQLFKNISHSS